MFQTMHLYGVKIIKYAYLKKKIQFYVVWLHWTEGSLLQFEG